jgi:excisionase family DNA binding protein
MEGSAAVTILTTKERSTTRPLLRMSSSEPGALLTVHEVAELLKVPVSWVYEHTRKRGLAKLPHLKLGKYLRFEEPAVREFLERQRIA